MPQKRHKPEEIAAKLRQVDVLLPQGKSVRTAGVTQFAENLGQITPGEPVRTVHSTASITDGCDGPMSLACAHRQ